LKKEILSDDFKKRKIFLKILRKIFHLTSVSQQCSTSECQGRVTWQLQTVSFIRNQAYGNTLT
jgi:hypothetical protein